MRTQDILEAGDEDIPDDMPEDETVEPAERGADAAARRGGYKLDQTDMTYAVRDPKIAQHLYNRAFSAQTEYDEVYWLYRAAGKPDIIARRLTNDYFSRESAATKRFKKAHGMDTTDPKSAFIPMDAFGDAGSLQKLDGTGEEELNNLSLSVKPVRIDQKLMASSIIRDFVKYFSAKTKANDKMLKMFTWMIVSGGADKDLTDAKDVLPFYSEISAMVQELAKSSTKKDPEKTEYLIRARLKIGGENWQVWRKTIRDLMRQYYKEKELGTIKESTDMPVKNNKVNVAYFLGTNKIASKYVPLMMMSIIYVSMGMLPSLWNKVKGMGKDIASITKHILDKEPALAKDILSKHRQQIVLNMANNSLKCQKNWLT
jgi:hypothetical protein